MSNALIYIFITFASLGAWSQSSTAVAIRANTAIANLPSDGELDMSAQRAGFMIGYLPILQMLDQELKSAKTIIEKNRAVERVSSWLMFHQNWAPNLMTKSEYKDPLLVIAITALKKLDENSSGYKNREELQKIKPYLKALRENKIVNVDFDSISQIIDDLVRAVRRDITRVDYSDRYSTLFFEARRAGLKFSLKLFGTYLYKRDIRFNGPNSPTNLYVSIELMQLQAKKIRHTLKAAGYDLFEIENFLFKYENFLEKTKQLVPQKQSLFRNYDADTVAANAQLRQLWLELPDAFDRVEEQALNEASAQQTIKACKHLFAN